MSIYSHVPSAISPEKVMWGAVIKQAIDDAVFGGDDAGDREKAISWLFAGGRDFFIVCDYAGIDPFYVRARAEKVLDMRKRGKYLRTRRKWGDVRRRRKQFWMLDNA